MTEKNIGLDCFDCGLNGMVSVERARNEECPNCHSSNVEILDELPEDTYK